VYGVQTFKRILLNRCQEEFETKPSISETLSEEERIMQDFKNRKRTLGNIKFIGELFKIKMLPEKIMHNCIQQLLNDPEPADIEAACKLMETIGKDLDHERGRAYMDQYFQRMRELSNDNNYELRIRFMIKDVLELRENRWKPRREAEGPKKIKDVHKDVWDWQIVIIT
jgi:translation initiation factor 4G